MKLLKAIAQIVPNSKGIEAPSRIEPDIEVSDEAFESFKNTGRDAKVSFEDDGISRPLNVTAYTLPTAVENEAGDVDIWPTRYIVK